MIPRDWFAGMALPALMNKYPLPTYSYSIVAAMAYQMADAMMAEREKHALVPQSDDDPGFDAFDGMGG